MGFIEEFKEFAIKGNMVDMAVGLTVGVSFKDMVSSLVTNVIMPPIGVLTGGVDFVDMAIVLKKAAGDQPAVKLSYGLFLNSVIDFIIIALVIFMVIKMMNDLREPKKEEKKKGKK